MADDLQSSRSALGSRDDDDSGTAPVGWSDPYGGSGHISLFPPQSTAAQSNSNVRIPPSPHYYVGGEMQREATNPYSAALQPPASSIPSYPPFPDDLRAGSPSVLLSRGSQQISPQGRVMLTSPPTSSGFPQPPSTSHPHPSSHEYYGQPQPQRMQYASLPSDAYFQGHSARPLSGVSNSPTLLRVPPNTQHIPFATTQLSSHPAAPQPHHYPAQLAFPPHSSSLFESDPRSNDDYHVLTSAAGALSLDDVHRRHPYDTAAIYPPHPPQHVSPSDAGSSSTRGGLAPPLSQQHPYPDVSSSVVAFHPTLQYATRRVDPTVVHWTGVLPSGAPPPRHHYYDSADSSSSALDAAAAAARSHFEEEYVQYTDGDSVLGNVRRLSKTQVGCRLLQQALESEDRSLISSICKEILPLLSAMAVDTFGNYVFQKVVEKASKSDRVNIVKAVFNRLVSAALNPHGTRSIQRAIEICCDDPVATLIMTKAILPEVTRLSVDVNGNHVVLKTLFHFPSSNVRLLVDAITTNLWSIARHRTGCCVIQKCLNLPPSDWRLRLLCEVVSKSLILMQDTYGNYVVQHVLDSCPDEEAAMVCAAVVGHVTTLAKQKFSSNVVEKCFVRAGDGAIRDMYFAELVVAENMRGLCGDQFGNYVVQKAIDVATNEQGRMLVEAIKPHLREHGISRAAVIVRKIMLKIQRRFPGMLGDRMGDDGLGTFSDGGAGPEALQFPPSVAVDDAAQTSRGGERVGGYGRNRGGGRFSGGAGGPQAQHQQYQHHNARRGEGYRGGGYGAAGGENQQAAAGTTSSEQQPQPSQRPEGGGSNFEVPETDKRGMGRRRQGEGGSAGGRGATR